ncbi:hypothetical protein B0T26DRAFT_718171 [Lasiosphaeria miniovina]|uniref:Uncharacterized protein n=1 Tax=Lasiosphaeria miniovina TaxID=1954250 RepID=A0AA40DUJ3_9PEZI|nr:uncharacterized protein B0T26DRAFT_718171 [Lasiosphaeria miniovina]KAK0713721.1 hypothetical protein B0T26DRAFT_718171 [Lasiosphaeria miniovina]
MACEFDETFIIIDAINECGNDNQVSNVVHLFKSLVTQVDTSTHDPVVGGAINIALFNRDEDLIRGQLQHDFTSVQIAAHTEDLLVYTASEVDKRIRN